MAYNAILLKPTAISTITAADAIANADVASVGVLGYNETTLDRWRNNTEVTALASAARTANTTSATFTNHNAKGILVFLRVTVNPGSAETLRIVVQEAVGNRGIGSSTADAFGGTAGVQIFAMYPAANTTPSAGNGSVAVALPLPRSYEIQVVHSASGSWTYSVDFALIN